MATGHNGGQTMLTNGVGSHSAVGIANRSKGKDVDGLHTLPWGLYGPARRGREGQAVCKHLI